MIGIPLPAPSRSISRLRAAKLIANVAARSPVEILALGPPTNVADALRASPTLGKRITSLTVMGGALDVPGNVGTGNAEWNFYVDPAASDIVLRSGIPSTLVPLDATNAVPYNAPFFERLGRNRRTAAARFVYEALSLPPCSSSPRSPSSASERSVSSRLVPMPGGLSRRGTEHWCGWRWLGIGRDSRISSWPH